MEALGALYFAEQFFPIGVAQTDALMCACNRSRSDMQLSEPRC